MLCNLKNKIGKYANITKDIRGIRQTEGGHLLVEMKQGSREEKNIVEKLKVGMTGEKISIYGKTSRKVPLNVYRIDIDMKEGQIHDGIKKALNISCKDMLEVKALRPLNGGRQAVTILVSEKVAQGLEYKSTVKLGWSEVEIKKKDDTKRSNRCWKEGQNEAMQKLWRRGTSRVLLLTYTHRRRSEAQLEWRNLDKRVEVPESTVFLNGRKQSVDLRSSAIAGFS
ncbi:hypothetical protein WA026_021985 [Henosepilachna vigintioctopunctata]|uniref:Uncharacterized protein n=1 Tax=Henosepilachna vigintioctopunctata TaxID=420089 RepID=A0AAW1VC61_9CUCU